MQCVCVCVCSSRGVLISPQPGLLAMYFFMVIMFRLMLVFIYIYSITIPPIMIINRIYGYQNLLSLQLVSFLVGLRTYQHPGNSSSSSSSRGVLISPQPGLLPDSRCIFYGQNISFDASLVILVYIHIYIVLIFLQL